MSPGQICSHNCCGHVLPLFRVFKVMDTSGNNRLDRTELMQGYVLVRLLLKEKLPPPPGEQRPQGKDSRFRQQSGIFIGKYSLLYLMI